MKDFTAIVLAAGEGTRMKSSLPKVLHTICGSPMIDYVLDGLRQLRIKKIVAVVNKSQEQLLDYLEGYKDVKLSFQKKPLGTADAVSSARKFFKGNILVICADTPLIRKETLQNLINRHKESNASCTILTAFLDNPSSFGRVIRDEYSKVSRIIEENDASSSQKQVKEVNSGIYCFNAQDLSQALSNVKMNTAKKEYYLTDVVEILYKQSRRIETFIGSDANEALGINSRMDLSSANEAMRLRIIENLMQQGVSIVDTKTTFINQGFLIGKETVIYPFTVIESGVKIGSNCSVGPFCHLRQGTIVKDNAVVGNFTEAVRSTIGEGTRCKHLSYLGDTSVGKGVNIGAGTVIANYDGENKNKTVIKDKSFIGCDTVIVAPATIGKGAVTGAGAVITKGANIKDNSVVVGVPAKPLVKTKEKVKAAKKVARKVAKKSAKKKKSKKR